MFLAIRNWLRKPDLSKSIRETNEALNREVVSYAARALAAEKRLKRIAALETPRCAHVGKVMARIARGEG
jgi:hypothetical protein